MTYPLQMLGDLQLHLDLQGDLQLEVANDAHQRVRTHLFGDASLSSLSLHSAQAMQHRFQYRSDLS